MREGVYDSLLTARLAEALSALDGIRARTDGLDEADAPGGEQRLAA